MICRKTADGWFFFPQDDHAKLSAQIMSAWGGGDFFFPDRPAELLFALSEHDFGWTAADRSPALNSNGEPENFTDAPPEKQCAVWRKSFGAHKAARPEAAALIALHFNKFNERALSRKSNKWSLALREEIKEFVAETLGIKNLQRIPTDTARKLKLLQTGDALSLGLCRGWKNFEITGVPLKNGGAADLKLNSVGENDYLLKPWPFTLKERRIFETEFTRVCAQKFGSEKHLADEINGREREKIRFSLSPDCW